jgi:hypothetical protein
MRNAARVGIAVACLSVAPVAAVQGDPPAAQGAYPLAVRFEVSDAALRAHLSHRAGGFFTPPNPGCLVEVGEQARDAHSAAVLRTFRGGGEANAVVALTSVRAALEPDAVGWRARVEHVLVLRATDGRELGRWQIVERERFGPGERAIPAALQRAAARAARTFERELVRAPEVTAWLREAGVEPSPDARPAPVAELAAAPPVAAAPPRRGGVYLEGGVAVAPHKAEYKAEHVVSGFTQAYSEHGEDAWTTLRAGFSGRHWFAQVAVERRQHGEDDLLLGRSVDVNGFGVEAGPALALGPVFELSAGAGLHRLRLRSSDASPEGRDETNAWSVVAVARFTFPVAGLPRTRLRVGVEARRWIDAELDLVPPSQQFDFRSTQTLALSDSLTLLVGVEFGR